ncbi:MAG: hypothetical protein HZA77_15790 [Candidatus Schekmanbacteria bacterium]|nr:hypothetical protein [Candidatus Schekmanbacteria bacterium]
MAISDKEEDEIRIRMREELERKEKERLEAIAHLKQVQQNDNSFNQSEVDAEKRDELRRIEIAEEEKRKFYKEKGYIPVKDRAGNLYWLTKEEYEEKKHRIKSKHSSQNKTELEITEETIKKSSKYLFAGLLFFVLLAMIILVATFIIG